MPSRAQRSAMAAAVASLISAPVGLPGELRTMALVRGVTAGEDGLGVDLEAVLAVGADQHWRGAEQVDLFDDGRPERRMGDHLVAGLEERDRGVEQRLLAAGGGDHLGRREGHAVVLAVAVTDRLAQVGGAGRRGVLGEAGVDGGMGGGADVTGRREVGLAGAEIDHVDAGAAQPVGFGGDLQRRRRRHPSHPGGQGHAFLGADSGSRSAACLLRSRSSTSGGTRPRTSPPSRNTSLISRELV